MRLRLRKQLLVPNHRSTNTDAKTTIGSRTSANRNVHLVRANGAHAVPANGPAQTEARRCSSLADCHSMSCGRLLLFPQVILMLSLFLLRVVGLRQQCSCGKQTQRIAVKYLQPGQGRLEPFHYSNPTLASLEGSQTRKYLACDSETSITLTGLEHTPIVTKCYSSALSQSQNVQRSCFLLREPELRKGDSGRSL